jgi:hypothetical protein
MSPINASVTPSPYNKILHLRGNVLMSVVALHFLVGLVAGSIFTVRTLLVLVALVLVEVVAVTIVSGLSVAFWSLGSLVAVQAGYLGGICFRSALERLGAAQPNARPRHPL